MWYCTMDNYFFDINYVGSSSIFSFLKDTLTVPKVKDLSSSTFKKL